MPTTLADSVTLATASTVTEAQRAAVDLAYCAGDVVWPMIADHPWAVMAVAVASSPVFAVGYKVAAHIVASTPTTIDDRILDGVARVADFATSKNHKRPE